jgi:hypothetical protein
VHVVASLLKRWLLGQINATRGQAEHLFIKADRPIAHGVEGTAGNQDVVQHKAQAFGGRQLQTRVPGWNKLVEKLFEAKLIEEGVDDGQRPERFGNESGLWRQGILPEEDLTADIVLRYIYIVGRCQQKNGDEKERESGEV